MKISRLLFCIAFIFILTGCVQGDYALKINKDGSGESTITVGIEEDAYEQIGGRGEGMIDSVNNELESRGYTIEPYEEDGHVGFVAEKTFDDVRDMEVLPVTAGLSEMGAAASSGGSPIEMETSSGLFFTTYKVKGEIDLERTGLLGGMQQLVANQMDLTFTLDLPISPKDHNADRTDGNRLQWDIDTAGETEAMVEVAVPKVRNIIVAVVSGLLVLTLLGFLIVRKRKAV
ncbi:LppM family (lipo)protein [Halobacillus sp. H74]|uniref:LppM family (lipo)protein n=1 Tax=Halobacillus sp. H74 TaxID=3457436 RepID=UPI003FCCE2AF